MCNKVVVIPDSVITIGFRAFYGCTGLTSVVIGNSVKTIGEHAFDDCTGLTVVTIPNSVKTIGSSAFKGCTGLTGVEIGNKVKTIGEWAFYGCTGLTAVAIPNSVKTIGGAAFYGCAGLTSMTIPNLVETIGFRAFYGCAGLTSMTIPDSVTSIGDRAFAGCTGLTAAVVIPDSVISIGEYAFYCCTGLTAVTIGDSVTSIGLSAFYGCTGLKSVAIPDSVTSIGRWAFQGCTGLTEIIVSENYLSYGKIYFGNFLDNLSSLTLIISSKLNYELLQNLFNPEYYEYIQKNNIIIQYKTEININTLTGDLTKIIINIDISNNFEEIVGTVQSVSESEEPEVIDTTDLKKIIYSSKPMYRNLEIFLKGLKIRLIETLIYKIYKKYISGENLIDTEFQLLCYKGEIANPDKNLKIQITEKSLTPKPKKSVLRQMHKFITRKKPKSIVSIVEGKCEIKLENNESVYKQITEMTPKEIDFIFAVFSDSQSSFTLNFGPGASTAGLKRTLKKKKKKKKQSIKKYKKKNLKKKTKLNKK